MGKKNCEKNITAVQPYRYDEEASLRKFYLAIIMHEYPFNISESAFSAGGHVIDPFRSRLDPEMVEALVCTKDWVAATKRGNNNSLNLVLVHDFFIIVLC